MVRLGWQNTDSSPFSGNFWGWLSLPQVHSVRFMEFSEVENQDDYYSMEAASVYTQDPHGVHIMYDEALSDLKELEEELLLVASHYIEKEKGQKPDFEKNQPAKQTMNTKGSI